VMPRWVAAPADAGALAALMRLATAQGLRVVARGGGTKLDWGLAPTTVDVVVDTGRLTGLHHHYADDLVAVVGAGTPLRAVHAALARAGQRLAVDPGSAGATVGGMLMTGEAGPLRLRYGSPRDQLIGAEFVRADGQIVHSGGRVVKNVAGYDLAKLLCGSYGTLGILTSATFRLQPIPAARAWVVRTIASPLAGHDLVQRLLASPFAPAAIEIDLPGPAGKHPVNTSRGQLALLLEGTPEGVAARTNAAVAILRADAIVRSSPPPWWGRYPFTPADVALKLTVPVADLHAAIYSLHDAANAPVPVRGSAGTGVCYAALSTVDIERLVGALDAVRTTLIARGGSCVVLDAPADVRDALDVWGPVPGLALMRAVKQRFDPDGLLAPGRFVGGI
jgi:glycolate oxidase FAD binding subunit